jgi:DNA repair exonuclease SbcCD ATPase subunit
MLIFSTLRWRNFLSTGQYWTEIQFTKSSTTLISGENGAGKSTMLDALCFVLFGKPYRNINIPQLPNSINEKDCLVEVEFSIANDRYKVRRGLTPRIFEVFKNDTLVDQDASSRDYQRLFEETILRMSYKAFCQVVILGSANYIPFMRLSAADRRAIVEAILDINIFSTMNTLLKAKVAKTKEDLTDIEGQMTIIKQKIALHEKYLESKSNDTKDRERDLKGQIEEGQQNISELSEEVESLRERIRNLLDQISDKKDTEKAANNLSVIHRQLKGKVKSITDELSFYEGNDTCPTCTQHIDEVFKTKKVQEKQFKLDGIGKGIEDIEQTIDKTKSRLEEIESVVDQIRDCETKAVERESSIKGIRKAIERAQKTLGDMEKQREEDSTKDSVEVDQLRKDADEMHHEREVLVNDQFYYGVASNLLKDSGIKGRIIKHYIPIINRTINRYLSQMSLFVNFTLDEEFTETIKSRHHDIFTYSSFSEGEKKKIDLALLFAWRAIASMKNSVSTNLLMMDEILDGSLDDTAVEAFLDILKGFDRSVNVFVISHKPKELLESKFERHLQFVKKNNFSRLV